MQPTHGACWWKGNLDVQVWESLDGRFPYALRSTARDASGNRLESEVTALTLGAKAPADAFLPPAGVQFYPPAQVRRGKCVAGGAKPVAGRVGIYLADAIEKTTPLRGRHVLLFGKRRLALDTRPMATEADLEEARLEPYGEVPFVLNEALVLYLKPDAAATLARASGRSGGRYLVVLIAGAAVSAPRIERPWAEEDSRIPILEPSQKRRAHLAKLLAGGEALQR